MKAIQYARYGGIDVLDLMDVEPQEPARGRIPVQVRFAALNPKDALFRKGKFRQVSGRRFPKGCGLDFSGTVLGDHAGFTSGQRVFGALNEWTFRRGTLAEVVHVRPQELAPLSERVGFEDAAAVPLVGLTALQALRDLGAVRPGSRVLINGASGGVGTAAVQIAHILGAHITTLSSSPNLGLCKELGAHLALDYAADDLQGLTFDAVFDVYGNLKPARVAPHLRSGGAFISTVPSLGRWMKDLLHRFTPRPQRLVIVKPNRRDLDQLGRWLASEELRSVVDMRVGLEDVARGFERLESRRTRGKITVEVCA